MSGKPCRKCGKQFAKEERMHMMSISSSGEPKSHAWLCDKCYDKWLILYNNYNGRRVMNEDEWGDCWNKFVDKDYVKPEKVVFT